MPCNNINRTLQLLVCGIPQRVILSLMGFLAIFNAYTMRCCLNVAITEMVMKKSHNVTEGVCLADDDLYQKTQDGVYDWDEQLQGWILSSFFWGYLVTHIPAGFLTQKFGGKYTLSLGILSTAIFTLLTPLAIEKGGPYWLIAVRVLEGLGEGTTFPALSALLATWIPMKERSVLGSLVFGGGQIGTIIGTMMSGLILSKYNYSVVFYLFGVMGIVWFIFFTIFCYNDPASHPFITEAEKDYLKSEIGGLERDPTLPNAPYRHIFTSGPMIALIFAQVGHDWGFYTMGTDLPKYMSGVLRFSIKENGLYSSLPYVLMWIVSIGSGFLSDWMITNKKITVTNARKLFTTIASFGPAIFMVGASYAGCDRMLVVILFTIAMGFMGTFYPGMKVNSLDLSPNYAGTLMAITNGIGALTGIAGPALVGLMTPNSSVTEWRAVFWIAFVVFNVTNLIYVIWASGDVQPWNTPHLMNKSVESNEENDERSIDSKNNPLT